MQRIDICFRYSYLDYGYYSDGTTLDDKELSNQVSQGNPLRSI